MNEMQEHNTVFFNVDDLSKCPGLLRRQMRKTRTPFAELVDFGIISRPNTEVYPFDLFNL